MPRHTWLYKINIPSGSPDDRGSRHEQGRRCVAVRDMQKGRHPTRITIVGEGEAGSDTVPEGYKIKCNI